MQIIINVQVCIFGYFYAIMHATNKLKQFDQDGMEKLRPTIYTQVNFVPGTRDL